MATDPKNAHLVTSVGGGSGSVTVEWHHEDDTALTIPFTVTAVPSPGWKYAYWMLKTQNANQAYKTVGNPYDFYLSPTSYYSEVVFEAYFEEDPEYQPTDHTITVAANPSNGGTVSGGGTYADGATCTISATAGSGRHFTKWVCSDGREITDASYTFTVGSSLTFTAQFAEGTGMPLCDGTSGQIMFGSNGEILFDG